MAANNAANDAANDRGAARGRFAGFPVASLVLVLLHGPLACAPSPSNQVQAKLTTVKEEQTPDKLVDRGKAFAQVGDLTRAEQYLAAAMDEGADDRVVVPLLLRVCIDDQRYRAAIGYASEYVRKHPRDTGMRFVLGTLEASVGEVLAAKGNLEEVCAEAPTLSQPHYALAVLLRDAKMDRASMDRHFREYLRLDPEGEHAEEARAALLKTVPQPPPTPLE